MSTIFSLSRNAGLDVDHLLPMPAMIVERGGRRRSSAPTSARAVAVDVHDVGLRRIAVAHVGDVADIDHRAVDALIGRSPSSAIATRELFSCSVYSNAADLLGADRGDQVLRPARWRRPAPEATRLQRRRIEVDLDLPRFAAIRKGNGGARHRHQRRADRR